MAQLSFRASAHEYLEKFYTTSALTLSSAAQDASPSQNSVQSYGFLRRIKLRLRNSSAGTGGNFAADAPQVILQVVRLTDPNGAEIYGGPTWSGWDTALSEKYGAYRLVNDPALSALSNTSVTAPLFLWTIPLECSASSGYGALPNFDAQSPYKLTVTLNTLANIYATAPTTNPAILLDGIIECWTLPDAVNKLTGLQQSQFPPGIGPMPGMQGVGCTVQHWTKSSPSVTASSAMNVALIRKGNSFRSLTLVVRNSAGARVALSNFPNPLTWALDGAPLWNNLDPAVILDKWMRAEGGQAGSTAVAADTGVLPVYPLNAVGGINVAGVDGTLGSQSWLGNNQASRIEFGGTWGSSAAQIDALTNDVNGVSLEGSAYAFAFGQQLAAASQPSVRYGS